MTITDFASSRVWPGTLLDLFEKGIAFRVILGICIGGCRGVNDLSSGLDV